ncbi:MAG: hypothetical protein KDJ38_14695, partial [Gammaproteobacteria bacterium]|nr:hypothetical protein [Gammaproteobacteria bacterium]
MRKLATAVAVSLALASSGAKALGLGDIEMHSALNQPLDAEILLHSVQPGELEELLVQLASREAFDRAGIERTSALTALKFSIDRKSDGTPFIKIGSNGPVVEPFLNFLLEVDWPKGRMVREYTILLDPPVFMNQDAVSSGGSTIVPETQSQAITEQDLVVPVPIERDDAGIEVVVADGAGAEVDDNTVTASGGDFPGEEVVIDSIAISSDSAEGNAVIGNNPTGTAVANRSPEIGDEGQVFLLDGVRTTSTDIPLAQTFSVDEPAPEAAAPAAVTTSTGTAAGDAMPEVLVMGDTEEVGNDNGVVVSNDVSPAGDESYLVERNDTLWQIAAGAKPANASVQQMMMALLRLNRDAFVDNNVNRLKAGAILRMPSGEEINATSRGEAVAMMTEQNRLWQEYRDSIGRVATAATSAAPATPAPTTPEPVEEEPAEVTKAPDASAPGVSESSDTTTAQQGTAEQTSLELKIVADPT